MNLCRYSTRYAKYLIVVDNLSQPVVKVLHQKLVLDAQVRVDFGSIDPSDQNITRCMTNLTAQRRASRGNS